MKSFRQSLATHFAMALLIAVSPPAHAEKAFENSWKVKKWFAFCLADHVENKNYCIAELNAFDLPEPKETNLQFATLANRVDIQIIAINGKCSASINIDKPHLEMNPATSVSWRNESAKSPKFFNEFRDTAGFRNFYDDENSSLAQALSAEKMFYLKTDGPRSPVEFSVSSAGYRRACESILEKDRQLHSSD